MNLKAFLTPKTLRNVNVLILVSVVGLLVAVMLTMTHSTTAVSPSVPLLSDETLTAKALTVAQEMGLKSAPRSQRSARMILSEWLTRNDAELGQDAAQFGLTSDTPVFVLANRGDVEWRGPGLPQPGQSDREEYDNITIVLNAQTGETIWMSSKYPGFPMPVEVP